MIARSVFPEAEEGNAKTKWKRMPADGEQGKGWGKWGKGIVKLQEDHNKPTHTQKHSHMSIFWMY